VLPKNQYIVRWDQPDGKSETVSHAVLMKQWSLTTRKYPDDSDDSSASSKSNHIIASSDDSNENDNGGRASDKTVKGVRVLIRRHHEQH
jgi:hypothetical protein